MRSVQSQLENPEAGLQLHIETSVTCYLASEMDVAKVAPMLRGENLNGIAS
jgi:hypothetical protein